MLQKKSGLILCSFWIISKLCSAESLSSIQGKAIDVKTKDYRLRQQVFLNTAIANMVPHEYKAPHKLKAKK